MSIGWTDERVVTLKRLWLEGLSASQIQRQLGGVTRNAVIGKVHRLGLSGRATPSKPRQEAYKAPRPAVRRVAPPKPATVTVLVPRPRVYRVEEPGSATVLTLDRHMCKWPIGDPAMDGFTFCGKQAEGSFCIDHARVAYQPQQTGKKKSSVNELARSLRRYI